MEEKTITERESIALITDMISRTKQRYIGNGNIMLMWGYLTVAVTILIWVLLEATHHPAWNWLWFLIWIVGGTATPIMARKQQVERGVKNYSDRITSQIWSIVGAMAIVATAMCLGFLFIGGKDSWSMMFAYALIIVPFGEIVQGVILKENALKAGGIIGMVIGIFTVCCIAGGVKLYANWYLPMFMTAFIAMFIIPGHILNHKASQEK